jgi:hypothetical protein
MSSGTSSLEESPTVIRIFELAAQDFGYKRIAKRLTEERAPAPRPRRTGRPRSWTPSSMRVVLMRQPSASFFTPSSERNCLAPRVVTAAIEMALKNSMPATGERSSSDEVERRLATLPWRAPAPPRHRFGAAAR